MSVHDTADGERELATIKRSQSGGHVELSVEVDVGELSPPRVNYVLDIAAQTEKWFQAFVPEDIDPSDVWRRNQSAEQFGHVDCDSVEAYATVDVSGAPQERVDAFVRTAMEFEVWFVEQVEDVRATARSE